MKRMTVVIAMFALSLLVASSAFAQATATHNLNLAVNAVTKISTSAGAINLTITDGVAGVDALTSVSGSGDYSITHNKNTNMKITAEINNNMPTDITLKGSLASTKGTTAGAQVLSTTPVNVVTAIVKGADANRTATYTLEALASAGEWSGARTVTLTLTD